MTELTIREILFPTDFSDVARTAGRTAADLARRFGARLHVLHVTAPVVGIASPDTLQRAVDDLGTGVTTVTASAAGTPAAEIVAYAARAGVDLIVMGTHGRSGVSRALLGSVTEGVVRRATCRVLTVPARLEPTVPVPPPEAEKEACIVCARPSPDLICAPCRALIRGESLVRKRAEERAGRTP